MLRQTLIRRRQAGFSLVEMMVAIVAGLIVIGAALAFTVSTVRAYSENIRSTRLSQELRTGMNLVVRELRRAGYDGASTGRVLIDSSTTLFRNLDTPVSDCIVYEYDRGGSLGNISDPIEKRAIRHNSTTGALQMLAAGANADCSNADSEWADLTDPRVIGITAFAPQKYETPFCTVAPGRDTDGDGNKDEFDVTTGTVTTVSLCLKGALAADTGVVRQMTDAVRIRADELIYVLPIPTTQAAADAICDGIAAAPLVTPPDPSELNTFCAAL